MSIGSLTAGSNSATLEPLPVIKNIRRGTRPSRRTRTSSIPVADPTPTSLVKSEQSAGATMPRASPGGVPESGQRERAVNPSALAYGGSNPPAPIFQTLGPDATRGRAADLLADVRVRRFGNAGV